jgi:hypothetical protein
MPSVVDITLGAAGAQHEVLLKLQGGDGWELNVWATFEELAELRSIRAASWDQRRSIRAGKSAGRSVFWAVSDVADPVSATVMIGQDDETWDIAFLVPIEGVEKIGALGVARHLC